MIGSLSAGDTYSGYRIDQVLGRGGMATVYLAQDIGLQRHVALKVIDPDLATDKDSASASPKRRASPPRWSTRTSSRSTTVRPAGDIDERTDGSDVEQG